MKTSELSKQEKERILAREKAISWRYIGEGAAPSDLFETYPRIKLFEDWPKEWKALAQSFKQAAEVAQNPTVKASNYMSATLYYHIASLGLFEDTDEKKRLYYSQLAAYLKGSKYFRSPAEKVEFPFRGTTLKALFRKAPSVEKGPCVIMCHGADATGPVEGHYITTYFLEEGISTLEPDLPGQYEARFEGLYMTEDFEKPISSAVDYLQTRTDVDADRIGLLGASFGGFISPRAAAFEKRVKCCISLGGFYGLDEFEFMPSAVLHLQNDMNVTPDEWQEVRKRYTLDGVIDKIACPLLVVNGDADTVNPYEQSVKIYENARCPKDLRIYKGTNHCVWYQDKQVLADMAKWARTKLYGTYAEQLRELK